MNYFADGLPVPEDYFWSKLSGLGSFGLLEHKKLRLLVTSMSYEDDDGRNITTYWTDWLFGVDLAGIFRSPRQTQPVSSGDNSWTADPPPPPPSDCKLWVSDYYSILRSRFDAIWNNHMATVTKDNPWGVEKGGVVSLHPERLDPATRQEETAVDHFDGPDGDRYSMSEDFNPWVIETKRKRGLDGWLRVTVHTHPGLDPDGNESSSSEDGISLGDFNTAPSSPGFDAVITPTKIFLYRRTGVYKDQKKKPYILCEIDRETGASVKGRS